MSWVRVIYYEKPIKYLSVRNCLGRKFILMIWDKNLGFPTGGPVAKPLWMCQFYLVSSFPLCTAMDFIWRIRHSDIKKIS